MNTASTQGTLAGTVFNDVNGDGIRASTDGGATGFVVFVDLNKNGIHDSNEPETKSTSTGHWQFAIAPGTYLVRLQAVAGWRVTTGVSATLKTSLGTTTTHDFGVSTTTLVEGIVFVDADLDGNYDTGETGLAGWVVYDDANFNGRLDPGERTAATDSQGRFTFIGLKPGGHQLRVVMKSGYKGVAPQSGYRSATLTAGMTIDKRDFAEKRTTA